MSIGSCIIDTVDIASIGAMVLRESDLDLLSFPARKDPPQVDWFERDGLDVDLSEAFFNDKKVTMSYYLKADDGSAYLQRLDTFIAMHEMSGLRQMYLRDLDKTFTLRYLGNSQYEHRHGILSQGRKCGFITLDYSMDEPLQLIGAEMLPTNPRATLSHITLNGHDLSAFGLVVSRFYDTALRGASVKSGISFTSERRTGLLVDTAFAPKKKSREITIDCTMMAPSREVFYDNYSALFNQATAGAVTIGYAGSRTLIAYYSQMTDFKKYKAFSSGIHVSFSLVFKTI